MVDLNKEEDSFKKILARFDGDTKQLRTGRVNISIMDDVFLEVYGVSSKISHVAAISSPDARSIVVKPWDKSIMPQIEAAIEKSNIGGSIISEKEQVRVVFPPLTEETRKDLVKILGKKTEEARISVRQHRDEIRKKIQQEEKDKIISEDQKFSQQEHLEKIVGNYNKKIEEISEKKENEIMTI